MVTKGKKTNTKKYYAKAKSTSKIRKTIQSTNRNVIVSHRKKGSRIATRR